MTAIILLNWNGCQDTIKCLESLFACTKQDFVWMVVDNGSEDESLREITAYLNLCGKDFSLVKEGEKPASSLKAGQGVVYALQENYGFAKGNNMGIALVEQLVANKDSEKPAHYLLLNNDTLVEPDFLKKLENFSLQNPQYVALTPQIRYAEQRNRIWNCGGRVMFGLRKYLYGNQDFSAVRQKEYIRISLITGCALFVKRQLLGNPDAWLRKKSKSYAQTPLSPTENTDLLTNRFFFGEEDFDFSLRMRKEGKKMACVLPSLIYHKIGATRTNLNLKERFYTHYLNRFIDIRQHYSNVLFFFWVTIYSFYIRALMVQKGITRRESTCLLRKVRKESARKNAVSKEDFFNATISCSLI